MRLIERGRRNDEAYSSRLITHDRPVAHRSTHLVVLVAKLERGRAKNRMQHLPVGHATPHGPSCELQKARGCRHRVGNVPTPLQQTGRERQGGQGAF